MSEVLQAFPTSAEGGNRLEDWSLGTSLRAALVLVGEGDWDSEALWFYIGFNLKFSGDFRCRVGV
ncbi:hypothetical protein [Paraburkholderia sediminicola]|uniref:hypothetical protein n=1 Tax=Paraburkholderia sediminicola TaxID=458836 RepID=UPI0038BCB23B